MPGFLASLQDKAQSALNASPLAGHLPSSIGGRASSPDQPSANQAAAQGGTKSHTLEAIQHQLRTFGQQYSSSTSPVQKLITNEKGVAIDFDSVSQDSKSQSKELYTWGQTQDEDLKDVTDRLAYLNFIQGSLANSLATKLDAARSPLKALRDAENSLAPRRNMRTNFRNQIGRIEHDQNKGMEKKLSELRDQLKKAERDDEPLEKEVELLKRKGVRESEQLKWDALREYGEKLILLAQASGPIVSALPTLPPTPSDPYTGTSATAAVRASLQHALDNYKLGQIALPSPAPDLSRSDTRSFGETHASELSSISSNPADGGRATIPLTPPPAVHQPVQLHDEGAAPKSDSSRSPPISLQALNNDPSPIPIPSTTSAPAPDVGTYPTVAETGVPVSAGEKGPGPASGSLLDIKAASPAAGPRSGGLPGNESSSPFGQVKGEPSDAPPNWESAEEEKKRLQREERERVLTQPLPAHETAEEEKKRLEREERERLLNSGGSSAARDDSTKRGGPDEDLPPYQDL